MKHLILIFAAVFCVSCTSVTGLRNIDNLSCPDTGFLRGHDRSAFTHEGVGYQVALTGLDGSCRFPSENEVFLKTVFTVVVKAGAPSAEGAMISVPYMATILDENENVTGQRDFTAKIEIKPNGYGLSVEEFEQMIPVETPEQAGKIKVIYSFPE